MVRGSAIGSIQRTGPGGELVGGPLDEEVLPAELVTVLMLHGRGVPGPGEEWTQLVADGLRAATGPLRRRSEGSRYQVKIVAPSYASVTGHPEPQRNRTKTMWLGDPIPKKAYLNRLFPVSLVPTLTTLWSSRELRDKPSPGLSKSASWYSRQMKDFQDYLRTPGMRDAVRDHLATFVPSSGRLVVVAHSQGTLVALDLLSVVPDEVEVDLLVTLGSPLAFEGFHSLLDEHHLLEAAPRATHWVNIADPDDLVTGGAALATSWPPARNSIDCGVDNSWFSTGSRHDAEGYLRQPALFVALAGALLNAPTFTYWDLPSEVTRAARSIPGRDKSTVAFRSRLSAIGKAARMRGHRATPSAPFKDNPLYRLDGERSANGLACAVSGLLGRPEASRENIRALLDALWDGVSRSALPTRIADSAWNWRAFAQAAAYAGLPTESNLWTIGPRLVRPSTHLLIHAQAPVEAITRDEWLFLAIASAIAEECIRKPSGWPTPPLHRNWRTDLSILGIDLGHRSAVELFLSRETNSSAKGRVERAEARGFSVLGAREQHIQRQHTR